MSYTVDLYVFALTKTRASACYGRVSPLTEFLITHGSGTSGLLPSASGPASLLWLPECVSVKFRLGAGSLKSLLKSLAPSDIKQTHNSLQTLHFPCVSLIHYVSRSLHLPFNSQSCRSLSLSATPPPLPCSSFGDVVSFHEWLPSQLPYENTISPFTSFSVSLHIPSSPLLHRLNPPLEIAQPVVLTANNSGLRGSRASLA